MDPAPDALALLMYTSGTTGQPKGVMLTQANLVANALAISREHRVGQYRSRRCGAAAVSHQCICGHDARTAGARWQPGDAAEVFHSRLSGIWRSRTAAPGSTSCRRSFRICSKVQRRCASDCAQIRFCRSASAALPPEHHRAFEAKFGIGIIETMGLTETVAPAFSNPIEAQLRKVGSVGRPSGCEARVVDPRGTTLPDGQIGEILIRGPQVTPGYYKNPEATAGAFFDDWLRSGDLGYRDADGFYFITGRIKELIIKGGENIAPREIDEALLRHPAVLDAAVVGIPDRHYGQDIMACVIVRNGHQCSEESCASSAIVSSAATRRPV